MKKLLFFILTLSLLVLCLVGVVSATGFNTINKTTTADTYVDNQNPTTNYGNVASVTVLNSTSAGLEKRSFLKFDLSGITDDIVSVTLHVYGSINSSGRKLAVYGVSDDSWSEGSVTWNSQPAFDSSPIAQAELTQSTVKISQPPMNITGYIRQQYAANDKIISVMLKYPQNTSTNFVIESKEGTGAGGAAPAYLEVITQPPTGHPRLLVRTEADKAKMISNRTNSDPTYRLSNAWSKIVNFADADVSSAPLLDVVKTMKASAMIYMLDGEIAYGNKAVSLADSIITLGENDIDLSQGSVERNVGEFIFSNAIIYDWCYSLLTNTQKTKFIDNFKRLAAVSAYGYPPSNLNYVVGFANENIYFRDVFSAGVAVKDEDPEMYNIVVNQILPEMKDVRDFFYPSGVHHQGINYGNGTRFIGELWASWIYKKMGAGELFVNQGLLPYANIYQRRSDGQQLRGGDSPIGDGVQIGTFIPTRKLFYPMTASYFSDTYFQQQMTWEYPTGIVGNEFERLLFIDPDLGQTSVTQLPTTRYFGSPAGSMIARTGWDTNQVNMNSPVVLAEMKIGEYNYGNHQHLDAGSFQIYYKGALAIDSGRYNGTAGGYGSAHHDNYYSRTIAHNSMLVYNPDELFNNGAVSNDGGQKYYRYDPKTQEEVLARPIGHVLAHEFGPSASVPEYSHLKGDLTDAYSSKVSNYVRSFVFLDMKNSTYPAAMVVYDRVTASDPDFQKYWLLHAIEQPVVTGGNMTTIKRTQNGYNGQLVNHTLAPANQTTSVVGGTGHEFDVFGTNYPNEPLATGANVINEDGAWRIMVNPTDASNTHTFLNAIQVEDKDTTPLTPVKIETADVIGAQIADRVVLFSTSGEKISSNITFTAPGTESSTKFVVTDLAAGTWESKRNGVLVATGTVTSEGGVFSYTGDSNNGSYVLRKLP